jgi:hypothetical protein
VKDNLTQNIQSRVGGGILLLLLLLLLFFCQEWSQFSAYFKYEELSLYALLSLTKFYILSLSQRVKNFIKN